MSCNSINSVDMRHPKLQEFLDTLKKLLDEVDDHLEERYGGR